MAEKKVDALLVSSLTNIRWLSGFSGSAGRIVFMEDRAVLVTDGRYAGQAEKELQASGADIEVVIEGARQKEVILEILKNTKASPLKLGLEAEDITLEQFQTYESEWFSDDVQLEPTVGLISRLRRQKDGGEIDRIKKAAEIADTAYQKVAPMLDDAPTEKEVARELEAAMLDLGADGLSFDTIVAAGEHSAWAHARPEDRVIKKDELVLIDLGALVDGYHSDMSRTSICSEPSAEPAEMYEVVKKAQQAGLEKVKAGVSCSEVDKVCREEIKAAGYGDAFTHSTGHGVGLDIHEQPFVSSRSDDVLQENEVITVEPGVYIPPHGGVRIEDLVLVTSDGCEVLTKAPKH